MTVSICTYNQTAEDFLALGVAADELGFHSLWLGEHLVLPMGYATEHPTTVLDDAHHIKGPIVAPDTELLEPLVALGSVAATTRNLKLATGVYVLPLRNPLQTARAVCTLQEISGGRFMFAIGAGWLREEFDALQVPFEERYGRYVETVEILRLAWAGGPFEFSGKYFSFGPIQVTTRPTPVPILFGGNGPKALRRAVQHGDGWFSSGTPTLPAALELKGQIEGLRQELGRTEPLRCYFRVEGFDPALIRQYHDEGIADVAVWADKIWPQGASLEDKRASLAKAAAALELDPRPA